MIQKIIILIFVSLTFDNSFGQKNEPITIGQRHINKSEVLNEDREYWVYLPSDYENSTYNYPVMYLLDGQEHFHEVTGLVNHMSKLVQRIPRMIIVGIISTENDRVRDYTPNPIEILSNGGGADNFIQYLQKELIPEIDNEFRTNNYRLIFGHSLAGVCVNHIFTNQNKLFNVYFITDPAIFVDTAISQNLKTFIANQDTIQAKYFLSVSGDVDSTTIEPNFEINNFIKAKYPNKLQWHFKSYPDEDHVSMTLKAIYDDFEELFSDYKIPTSYIRSYDKEKILSHIENNEDKFKIHVALPEQLINEYAMHFCSVQKYDDALELLQLNLANYKNPYETYYFIGQVYLLKGNEIKTLEYFEKSYEIQKVWDVKEKIEQIKKE